jgi:hypothetical protein
MSKQDAIGVIVKKKIKTACLGLIWCSAVLSSTARPGKAIKPVCNSKVHGLCHPAEQQHGVFGTQLQPLDSLTNAP